MRCNASCTHCHNHECRTLWWFPNFPINEIRDVVSYYCTSYLWMYTQPLFKRVLMCCNDSYTNKLILWYKPTPYKWYLRIIWIHKRKPEYQSWLILSDWSRIPVNSSRILSYVVLECFDRRKHLWVSQFHLNTFLLRRIDWWLTCLPVNSVAHTCQFWTQSVQFLMQLMSC